MDYPSESNIYQIDVYGREPYVPENDTPPQYYDEYGAFTPAHPSVDDYPYYYEDEYGEFMPAHPSVDDYPYYEDEFGEFMPAHPD